MGAHRNSIYDKAYAEMYAKGMSLAETAKSIGVTRQCVYKAFKSEDSDYELLYLAVSRFTMVKIHLAE